MKNRFLPALLLLLYIFLLVKVMVLKDVPMIRMGPVRLNFGGTQVGDPNYVPFKTIFPYLMGDNGFLIGALNIGGNIAFLIPVGFLLPFLFARIGWKISLVIAVLAGLSIELTQVSLQIGIFDIDDVILNGFGLMVGFWCYLLIHKIMSSAYRRLAIICLSGFSLVIIISMLVFVKQNDIGFEPLHNRNQLDTIEKRNGQTTPGIDPCNGTMGTGQVMSIEASAIRIKKRDGKEEVVVLTERTSFSNSAGKASKSILKVGDRVTVVIDDSNTAMVVLVCGIQ